MSFKNKAVIVTGSSSGIGAVTAIEFAKEGASVAIVGRNADKLKKVAAEIEKIGAKLLVINADVGDDSGAKRIIDEVIEKFGKIDVLVNNAGFVRFGSILDRKLVAAFDSVVKVNVRAHMYITTLAAPHLIKTKGNIVNVSSVAGKLSSFVEIPAYAISKAALSHFSRCAAFELAEKGVRVNTVSPGPVDTDILENGGLGKAKHKDFLPKSPFHRISESIEVADVILFLASSKAIGITGSEYFVDNGMSIKG